MKLLLFDIDGTLLDSGGAGTRALEAAFREVAGLEGAISGRGGTALAGKTDLLIIREVLEKYSLSHSRTLVNDVLRVYLDHLRLEINNDRRHLKPGVPEVLGRLSGNRVGLLTGNIAEGAGVKLRAFGIEGYFRFGAYGGDNEDRNKLLPEALKRYKLATGREAAPEDCVVIGDTPRDVQCAKPYGAYAIAVATGPYGMEELRRAGADLVVEDMRATEFLAALGG